MGFARAAGDRMILMDEGQIVEEATPEKLLTSTHERTKQFLSKVLNL
jgi:ABC-type polar amino acid transport system ATPase subunit